MDINVLGTSYGLALASGVNAYIPLLCLLLFHQGPISSQYAWLQNPGFLIALVVLALLDLILDKIPVLDTFWDSIHTIVRPVMGAFVAVMSMSIYGSTTATGTSDLVSSSMVITPLLGGALAGAGHTTKAVGRLTVAIGAFGCLNTIISVIEDVVMLVIVLLSFVSPPIMLGITVVAVLLFLFFSPIIFEAFKYNMHVSASLFAWTVFPFIWLRGEKNTTDVLSSLTEEQQKRLYAILPPAQIPDEKDGKVRSVCLLWVRRLDKTGPWGRRRIAPPTWLIILQDSFMFYPPSRPKLAEKIAITDIRSYKFRKSIFRGLLQILTHDGSVYTFTVPKAVLKSTDDCVKTYFPPDLRSGDPSDQEHGGSTRV